MESRRLMNEAIKKLYAENSSLNAGENKTTVIALDNENDASSGKIY